MLHLIINESGNYIINYITFKRSDSSFIKADLLTAKKLGSQQEKQNFTFHYRMDFIQYLKL